MPAFRDFTATLCLLKDHHFSFLCLPVWVRHDVGNNVQNKGWTVWESTKTIEN